MSLNRRCFLAGMALLISLSFADIQHASARVPASPDETVSFSREMSFEKALEILGEKSKHFASKPIVVDRPRKEKILVQIVNLPWRDALTRVAEAQGLKVAEYVDYFQIYQEEGVKAPEWAFGLDTKEVRIAAIFFEGNRSALKDLGVNWSLLGDSQIPIEAKRIITGGKDGFSVEVARKLSSAFDATSILQAFETRDIGEVIANPLITVISGQEGRIQVGDDIPYITRDEAGNVFPTFVSTGIILTVKPEVIPQDGMEFIHLEIITERSSGAPGAIAPTITRASTNTSALLRDGEQVVIAGLYSNQELETRSGIPFLRDLPWWALGLRYLTGYNSVSIVKKELVVLIQAHIVPSVRERMAGDRETVQELIERERQGYEDMGKGIREVGKP
ncbi:MAG: type II and III secretion system protein [Candidatus Latescibacterota bacterium]